ncbi:Ger(x)C family spore germination protein [Aneurinibacillus sp. UBA3580]|jgi:Ger(x)C family germination protein|uniref:Ger(x)C family spore germination protein n=1 Tax=Aneurinibacillus sp. UBA3580 TaxID=1946041 RepID=UPI00257C1058|nr:Ger(x)C family spore germination protein [Aneurinibacillus sp. UBA3580]
MIKRAKFILACFWLLLMPACREQLDVEKTTLSLVYGFDMDRDNKIIVYQVSPVFNKDAKKKYEVYGAKTDTTRQAREVFNSVSNGEIATGKLQVLMFSERLLKKESILPYLDVAYRDPKNTGNMRMVAVKGSVSSIVNSEFSDKPALPMYLTNVVDVEKESNRTAFVTLQQFHTLAFDKGITPAISEIKKGKNAIVVTGSALLDNRGVHKMSLNRRESALLLMLQKKSRLPVSLTIRMPSSSLETLNIKKNRKNTDFVTVDIVGLSRSISTHYKKSRFLFDVKMNLEIDLVERTLDVDMKKKKEQLTAIITDQLEKELNGLIQKVQKQHLDPFGFGWYARAYQYQQWKKVDNRWPDEFSRATVTVTPIIKIKGHGVIQ